MKTVVLIPTFNESENVVPLLDGVARLGIEGLEAVVIDDASPDGTAQRVREYAQRHPFASVIERDGPKGRGHAGREGYRVALARGAERVVEMDGDLSHDPRYIPSLLAAAEQADVVLGSRFVSGGRDTDRALWRRWLTLAANAFIRVVFGVSVRDANSGFRCFRREALETIDPETLASGGPAIVQEVVFRADRRGLRLAEVPVVFVEREHGDSKLSWRELWQGYVAVLRLRADELRGRRR
ncbi:MAG: polyprenol monophosphomannose synthase [Myxococcales bacterium]|nr:polyprenol monophosphomannose synthase [Myxococcales bacterium]